jgi:hypothetical protein
MKMKYAFLLCLIPIFMNAQEVKSKKIISVLS